MLPKPSPFEAPLTRPAISTKFIVVGIVFSGLTSLDNSSNLESGTITTPKLGSIVQNWKLAASAFPVEIELNNVDFQKYAYKEEATEMVQEVCVNMLYHDIKNFYNRNDKLCWWKCFKLCRRF